MRAPARKPTVQPKAERIAMILIDLKMSGLDETTKKWNISRRTLQRYKEKFQIDPEMAQQFQKVATIVSAGWQAELTLGMTTVIDKLVELVRHIDVTKPNPTTIEAVTNVLEKMAEIQMTMDMMAGPKQPPFIA
jgi:hypothetical protein